MFIYKTCFNLTQSEDLSCVFINKKTLLSKRMVRVNQALHIRDLILCTFQKHSSRTQLHHQ